MDVPGFKMLEMCRVKVRGVRVLVECVDRFERCDGSVKGCEKDLGRLARERVCVCVCACVCG